MAIDPNIILGIKQPQVQQISPLDNYAKVLGLKNAIAQGDMQSLQLQQTRQGIDADQRIRALLGTNPKATPEEIMAIDPKTGMQYAKNRSELEKSQADIERANAAAEKDKLEVAMRNIEHGSAMLSVAKENPAAWPTIRTLMMAQYPKTAGELPEQYDPAFIDAKIAQGQTVTQRLAAQHQAATLAETQRNNRQSAANQPFIAGPDGKPVANAPVQQFQLTKAATGAPRTSVNLAVNTEKNLLSNIGDVVGKDIGTAVQNARGAVGTLNTVNQIRQALDTGKVIAGPGTTARQFLGQVGQVIGIAGKDATEKLTNTRSAIQGLAQLELDAAQQMRGQGQITEAERSIIRRAASGDIDTMTVPELRTLTTVLDKTARQKIQINRANVNRLAQNPNAAPLVDYMKVDEPAPYVPQGSQNVRDEADAILRGSGGKR